MGLHKYKAEYKSFLIISYIIEDNSNDSAREKQINHIFNEFV